jgi:hypothetical protein
VLDQHDSIVNSCRPSINTCLIEGEVSSISKEDRRDRKTIAIESGSVILLGFSKGVMLQYHSRWRSLAKLREDVPQAVYQLLSSRKRRGEEAMD